VQQILSLILSQPQLRGASFPIPITVMLVYWTDPTGSRNTLIVEMLMGNPK
jgi:hypothetical protein